MAFIAYITAQTPWGSQETFILPEVNEVLRQGHEVTILPVQPGKVLGPGDEPEQVVPFSIRLPLWGIKTIVFGFLAAIYRPLRTLNALGSILQSSGSIRKLMKNMAVFMKGLATAYIILGRNIDYIHAHWASTPSTVAYVAAEVCNLPWSFTAHRWDIAENNMLKQKAASARFIRAIDRQGQKEIQNIIGEKLAGKCIVIHMGVDLGHILKNNSMAANDNNDRQYFILACPANMFKKKGHRYLIDACQLLKERGYKFRCWFFGDGPLEKELKDQVSMAGLEGWVEFKGRWAHNSILELYRDKQVDAVVLPSIETKLSQKEGIPVSLMEAMAFSIPVISTYTGGIPELLKNGAGILVKEKDKLELADAIESLMVDPVKHHTLGEKGYNCVAKKFNNEEVVKELISILLNDNYNNTVNLFEING